MEEHSIVLLGGISRKRSRFKATIVWKRDGAAARRSLGRDPRWQKFAKLSRDHGMLTHNPRQGNSTQKQAVADSDGGIEVGRTGPSGILADLRSKNEQASKR